MGKIKTRFSDFNVKSKLTLLIFIFIGSSLIMGFVASYLFKSTQALIILVNGNRVFTELVDSGIEQFYNYELTGNPDELEKAYAQLNHANDITYSFAKTDSIIQAMPDEDWVVYFFDIYKEAVNNDITKVESMGKQVSFSSKLKIGELEEIQNAAMNSSVQTKRIIALIKSYNKNQSPEKFKELQSEFQEIHRLAYVFAEKVYSLNDYVTRMLLLILGLTILLLVAIVSFIAVKISNSISHPINKLAENFKKIATGNMESSVQIDTKNEVGQLSSAFSEIQVGLQDIITYTKKVARGDYSITLKPKSDDDELTPALNKMASGLEEIKIKNKKETWIQNGISGLDDEMRGNYSIRELSEKIIVYLSRFLEVEMGAVYVFDEVLEHLELTGSVGLNTEDVKEKIQPGEGLVGKAALNHSLQIVSTKNKFHKIFSATGEIIPEKIYLLPMHHNNRVQAVIELAPVNGLSENKVAFLQLITEKISANIGAAVARYRHKELLDQTIEQAEILKKQEEKLRLELDENNRIRESLSQEKALLDSMLSTLPDYVYFKDTNSKFLRVSESMADRFGIGSTKEIIGKSDFDFRPKQEAQKFFNEEQEIIQQGKGFIDQIRNGKDRNGEEYWNSVTKLPMYDENGKCLGTFGISKDITHIKKLEIEVRSRNEDLKKRQEELKAVNERLNQQQEEMKATNEELKSQEEELRVANEELKSQEEELRVANEELAEQTKILTDSKKRLQNQQEKLQEVNNALKQASQYKSEFLANMSHELRTPLNSLLILSKLLVNNKKGNLTEDQLKSVNIIYKSGKDLLELINEILDLSKIEAGKMTYNFVECSTEEIKSEIIQGFKPVAENKKLALELKQSDDFPEVIYTDKQRLMQIIKNLLSNAFKFTREGGVKVHFGLTPPTTELLNPDLNNTNTYYIAVEDSGVGIPKNKAEAIFEAFQQADGSISRNYGGTGLGLSISKQLTRVLGGEIHVDSTEGEGSVFTVYLPLDNNLVGIGYKNEQVAKETISEKSLNPQELLNNEIHEQSAGYGDAPVFVEDDRQSLMRQMTVLIIHDEKEKARKLIELCHNRKFDAVAASSIRDGIKLAGKYSPQAIIISAGLKDSDGFKILKKNKFTNRLPLHLVSRIEDSVFDNIEDLTTPESENFQDISKNIENKISKEFRQVLVVEDDPITRESIQILFEDKDIIIHEAKTGQQAYEMISTKPFDCVILDLGLPDFSGNELLQKLKLENIPIPNVIIHTARELSARELRELHKFSDSIVIKGIKSDERLMDEVTLFLHQVANKMPRETRLSTQEIPDNSGFKGKKVLVVDDDIRNVFALAQILEEREIEVIEAENGEVAVDTLKTTEGIDLVLMDIMMPVMDGYEAMKIIRNSPGLENIPIISLSAKAMKDDYQKAIDCGANDYISKPVDVQKLLSLLKIWLFK